MNTSPSRLRSGGAMVATFGYSAAWDGKPASASRGRRTCGRAGCRGPAPATCKVAPNGPYRIGGRPPRRRHARRPGRLHRAGLLHDDVHAVHAGSLDGWPATWDIRGLSQEEAAEAILSGRVTPGTVLVIRSEGPRGGPGMHPPPTALRAYTALAQSADKGAVRELADR
ncbi:hypothetical protein [Nonomuraea sp. KM90]|uniref:hypothetical protein n=1 Tax=Nonomuraea sp. KM90 TaxID=3457428 RepID=UPI003FCDD7DF